MVNEKLSNSINITMSLKWYQWFQYTKHHHMSLISLPAYQQFLPKLACLSILILKMAYTAWSAGHFKNKWHAQISQLGWICCQHNEIRLMYWCFVYWIQWYHVCDNILDIDRMMGFFRPLHYYCQTWTSCHVLISLARSTLLNVISTSMTLVYQPVNADATVFFTAQTYR